MKDYLFLFRGGLNFKTASQEQVQQSMAKWRVWMDDLAKAGKLIGGERLMSDGLVVRDDGRQVIDGPFTEGKDMVGGYIGVRADDIKGAAALARGCPIFIYGGNVEVREIIKM